MTRRRAGDCRAPRTSGFAPPRATTSTTWLRTSCVMASSTRMNARTEAQKTVVAIAAAAYGQGEGADNHTTGALILYIQELEDKIARLQAETRRLENDLVWEEGL